VERSVTLAKNRNDGSRNGDYISNISTKTKRFTLLLSNLSLDEKKIFSFLPVIN